MELQSAYDAALADRDHAEAARLQPVLETARVELAVAEATVTALQQAAASIEHEQAERHEAAAAAERQANTQAIIADAMKGERAARDGITRQVDLMWAHIAAAQAAYAEAVALEDVAGHEYRRVLTARVAVGELDGMPHRIAKPNAASLLAEQHRWLAEMLRWRR